MIFIVFHSRADNRSDIYQIYLNGSLQKWKIIIDQLNKKQEKSNEQLIELVDLQYGYIGGSIETNRKDEASAYLKLLEENIKILEAKNYKLSMVIAYKAAMYGYRIGLNHFMAPIWGPKSSDCANRAVQLDPNNAFAYIQLGNVRFHSPSLMGGSKSEAIELYLKAKSLMENNVSEVHGNWNYLNLLVTLAKCYTSTEDYSKAKSVYEDILGLEPDFRSVKEILLPELMKKMK